MKITKRLLFVLAIGLASFVPTGCKKGNIQYSFNGKIVESLSGNPLSGVAVKISQKLIQNGTATGEGHSNAGTATTDSGGNFDIIFDRKKVTEFIIKFTKDDYFPLELLVSSANVSTEEVNTYNEELEPKSWIRLDITNSVPSDDDHFRLVTHNFREGCFGCTENTTVNFFGALDTSIMILTTAGVHTRFTYVNVNTGTPHTDSIYTVPFETAVYSISY